MADKRGDSVSDSVAGSGCAAHSQPADALPSAQTHRPGGAPWTLPSCGGAPRREKVGAGGGWLCGAVGEQLYFPSCPRGAAPALSPRVCQGGRRCPEDPPVCLPDGAAGRVPCGRGAPRASPAPCFVCRSAARCVCGMNGSARSGEQGWGCCKQIMTPPKSGDGVCDSAGHRRPWAELREAHPAAQAFNSKGKAEPESTGKERK